MKDFLEPDDEHDSDDIRNVPQYTIERSAGQVEEIMRILEIPEIFVSDETVVADFNLTHQQVEHYNHKFKSEFGIEINNDKFIWEIAEEIYESQF